MTRERKTFFIIFLFTLLSSQFVSSQIIEEGKGIDSIRIGIKESKVVKHLGHRFIRKSLDDNEYTFFYSKEALTISFDKDSIVYEISLNPKIKRQTSKGLIITNELNISDVEKVYGNDGWYTESNKSIDNDMIQE